MNGLRRFIKTTVLVLSSVLAASHGWTINCQYSTYSISLPGLSSIYSCQAELFDDGSLDITSVTGTHEVGKTLADVSSFYIPHSNALRTYKIPSNFGTTFPSLRFIDWTNTKLETIKASDLQAFPNLITLRLNSNFLRHIDGDLFKYNTLLQQLDLSGNFIDYIGIGIFNGLTQLNDVYVTGNICTGYSGMYNVLLTIKQDYSAEDMQADLEHLCGPIDASEGTSGGVCSANCTAHFDAIEAEVTIIETRLTAAWYEKLKWFFRTAFGQ